MNKLNRAEASPERGPGPKAGAGGMGGGVGGGAGGYGTPAPTKPGVTKAPAPAPARGGMGAKPAPTSNPIDNMPIGGGGKNFGGYDQYDDDDGYGAGGANLVPCSKCGRNFAEDRIGKHQKNCKVNSKPKKVKQFHKPITEKEKAKMDAVKEKTSKWRQQHEDFVNAMKYNRQVQAVEQRGGDIRKLAPPPQSSQAGLVPCPHCGRKFGEVQAAKHIPACANTVNKPKPPPGRAGGGFGGSNAAYGGSSGRIAFIRNGRIWSSSSQTANWNGLWIFKQACRS